MHEVERFIRDAAIARGIDPGIAVRVADSEGSSQDYARRGTFSTGSSWWPFQLHYGGPGYEYLGTVAGMGNSFTRLTGWQPGEFDAWRDSIRYALNQAKLGGWGPWYGAAHIGITGFMGIDRTHPWDANAEVWDFEQKSPDARFLKTSVNLNFRSGPGTEHDVIQLLPRDTLLEPVTNNSWRQVRLPDGRIGWVAAEYLDPT